MAVGDGELELMARYDAGRVAMAVVRAGGVIQDCQVANYLVLAQVSLSVATLYGTLSPHYLSVCECEVSECHTFRPWMGSQLPCVRNG